MAPRRWPRSREGLSYFFRKCDAHAPAAPTSARACHTFSCKCDAHAPAASTSVSRALPACGAFGARGPAFAEQVRNAFPGAGPSVRGNRESGRPRMVAPCLECAVGWPNSILKLCLDLCFLGLGLHQGGLPKITVQRGLRPSFSMYPFRRRCPHWQTPRPRLPMPKSAKKPWRTASRFLRSRQNSGDLNC